MREAVILLVATVMVGTFFLGMSYKEADIVRSCDNYKTFTLSDARYTCTFSHKIE